MVVEDVLYEISKLMLTSLDDDWAQAIHLSEFLEFSDFPEDYKIKLQAVDIYTTLNNIRKALHDWLILETTEDKSWTTLSILIPYKKIMAFLGYYIDYGSKHVTCKISRRRSIMASQMYYKLLCIPGFRAYNVYHPQLFTQSLFCLNYPKAMCESDNSFNAKELTKEVNSLLMELNNFIRALRSAMEHLRLKPNDMNFEDILSSLVGVIGGAPVNKLNVDKLALTNICKIIYEMIDDLLCDIDGNPIDAALKLLFKCLLPKLTSASVDNKSANTLVRASYVSYTGLLLSKYGKAALPGYSILLQHLCYTTDGLERAEVRTTRVSLVWGLMSLLPRKSYKDFVEWVIQLSSTNKITHRQIALEMLANFLKNEPEEPQPDALPPDRNSDQPDAENQDADDQSGSLQDSGIQADGTLSSTMSMDDSSQGSHEDDDNESSGLLQARAHLVPHGALLRAVYQRANDTSSALRTRALYLLAEYLGSRRPCILQAVQELNGTGEVSRLMALGARSVCDDRALVRRAAVGLVHRLLSANLSPEPAELGILTGLCRDASIIVRSAAISAMGDLVMQNPSDVTFDAFLSGPMNQLTDPESKVQEIVVSLVKHLLLDKLEERGVNPHEAPHPWLLLAAITRNNMRRHLQKACTVLGETAKCINHRVVDVLSTHLLGNEERDLHSLVLLTSVARLVDYSDVRFVIDYLYKVMKKKQCDVRLTTLTLELLSLWSSFVTQADRTLLRDFLVARLASDIEDGCRIPCVTLAVQLDPDNINWASELMEISESRAVKLLSVDELVRAADLSLVAAQQPSRDLIRNFLRALTKPPQEWEAHQIGACVVGVGRLCLRSREVAAVAAPVLAELLPAATTPLCARINALYALSDICTRYTSIVEPLLGSVSDCLRDGSPTPLRRAASRALSRLLLAGFLRMRAPLIYQYCAALTDEDHEVRGPAEYLICSCVAPEVICVHFVNCVIYYNKPDAGLGAGMTFNGRQLIYDLMMQRLKAVQVLNVQNQLAREVVAFAADVAEEQPDKELPASLQATLLDTIHLLCSPRMKLTRNPNSIGETDVEELQARVTSNIVSHKMKMTSAEVVVPAVLRLFAVHRVHGGQLTTYLVRLATDLLNDYHTEIAELLDSDDELVERIAQFEATIGSAPTTGNLRNLVAASTGADPATPRAPPRRRPAPSSRRGPPSKRTLLF